MGLKLTNITDPRDNLEKARLLELIKFAERSGVEIPRQYLDKAIIVRGMLRAKGLVNIDIPRRVLGVTRPGKSFNGVEGHSDQKVETIDAATDLMRQVEAPAPIVEPRKTGFSEMAGLRKELKQRGIKIKRTDKMADLKAKLNGEDAPKFSQ